MKKLGLIVNPVAGMGGKVGLKGSDGVDIIRKARELGAIPESPVRAVEALSAIARLKDQVKLYTYPREMGEDEAVAAGFEPEVFGSIISGETGPDDTRKAAHDMARLGVDLILFAGGDGTARDIFDAIGDSVLVLGIPSGVKIHSGVYAVTSRQAGDLAAMVITGALTHVREAEVMDIDEDAFREGEVSAKLYGYLKVPEEPRFVQNVKSGSAGSEREILRSIASDILITMEDDWLYIFGPGTTTRYIVDRMGGEKTLLGVDVILNRKLVAKDVGEKELLRLIEEKPAKIVVTVIGGQGYIFGRGNQQISAEVIKKVGRENIIIVASKNKLISLGGRPLLVDTRDEGVDRMLSGYMMVTTGLEDYVMYKVGY